MRCALTLLAAIGLAMLSGCGGKAGVQGDMDKMDQALKDGDLKKATEMMAELDAKTSEMSVQQKAEFQKLQDRLARAREEADAPPLTTTPGR